MLQIPYIQKIVSKFLRYFCALFFGIVYIFWIQNVGAIDTIPEGYRVNSNATKMIDASLLGGQCRIVTAPNLGKDYFIATKSLPEWDSFLLAGSGLSFILTPCDTCTSTGSFFLQVAGTSDDQGTALASLPTGDIVSGGNFAGTNTALYGERFSSSGGADIYLAQLTSTGVLKYFPPDPFLLKGGGVSADYGQSITTDLSGNILVTGAFAGTNTDLFGQPLSSSGVDDIYIAKLSSTGNLMWLKKGGGATTDFGQSISTDSLGDILVTGYFTGTGTDIFGQNLTSSGGHDIYIAKLSSTGNLMWLKKGGGTVNDIGNSTSIDSSGNILVTGQFQGTNTDLFGQNLSSSGLEDIFLAKLSSTGNLIWLKKGGGTATEAGQSTSTDSSGNILVTGYFQGTNTDIFGQNLSSSGGQDIFIAKLSSTGNLIWVRKSGNTLSDYGYSTTIDSSDNIILTGFFQGTNTDIFGTPMTSSGTNDVFIAKLTSTGNLIWVKKGGGTSSDIGQSVMSDSSGNILVTGQFQGTDTDLFGQSLSSSGSSDAYIVKLSSTGNLMWVKKGGNTGVDRTYSISTNSSGSILVTGQFQGTGTDLFGENLSTSGTYDIFLAKFDPDGNLLSLPPRPMIEKAGGTGEDTLSDMDTNVSGNILVSGYFAGASTDIFSYPLTSSGGQDGYIAYLDGSGSAVRPPFISKKAGGIGTDVGYQTTTDPDGNIFMIGNFQGTNTDIFGQTLTSSGNSDIFVAKLSSTGNLIWEKKAGGTGLIEVGNGISLDDLGNIYTLGQFSGTGTDIFGTFLTSSGLQDAFLAKLSSTGNLMWVKKTSSTTQDYGYSASTDGSGNTLITGSFAGTNVDIFGQTLSSSGVADDIFVVKLSSTGNLMWAKKAGGTLYDSGKEIILDSSGNTLIAGTFQGANTDIFGQLLTSSGGYDVFVAKLSSTGNLMWVKRTGGSWDDDINSILKDSNDNVIVTGTFQNINISIFGQLLSSSGGTDIFLAKLSSTGNLMWAERAGGATNEYGYSTSADSSGNILLTGVFQGTGTDLFGQALTSSGGDDVFLTKLSSTGNLMWAKKAGGTLADIGRSIAIDSSDNIITTGTFFGEGIDIFGQLLTSSGSEDIYLAKLDPDGNPDPYFTTPSPMVFKMGGAGDDSVDEVQLEDDGSAIVGGVFQGTDTDIFGIPFTSSGLSDIFLAKLTSIGGLQYSSSRPVLVKGGGTSDDYAYSTITDSLGNILVTGSFQGSNIDFFGQTLSSTGNYDMFLAKLTSTGNLIWLKSGGGASVDFAFSTVTDASDNVIVTGSFEGTNADLFGQPLSSSGSYDIFVAKLSSTGNLMWVKKGGGISLDTGASASVDGTGNVFVTGHFVGTGTDIFGQNLSSSGGADVFLAKLSSTGNLMWVKKGGGTSGDSGASTSTDTDGNVIVTGSFVGTNVDFFGQNISSSGGILNDVFLAKLSSTGNIMWIKKGGGGLFDRISSSSIDSSGSILVTGSFQGTNTDLFGQNLSSSGDYEIYVAKLSSTGNVMWLKKGGNTGSDEGYFIANDPSDNVLITGTFTGTGTDIFGQNLSSSGSNDVFIAKLSSMGNLIWVKKGGGTSSDIGESTATDNSGNILVTGVFKGTNTDLFGQNLSGSGNSDIFLTKLDSDGNILMVGSEALVYNAGGVGDDGITDIDVNTSGNSLISGYFEGTSTDIFGVNFTSSGGKDGFFSFLGSTGSAIAPTYLLRKGGGIGSDSGRSVTSDSSGNIIITGNYDGSYPTNFFGTTMTGQVYDTFIAKFSTTGALMWVRDSESYLPSFGFSTAVDNSDNIIIAGTYNGGGGFDDFFGESIYAMGLNDIYVAKLSSTGVVQWVNYGGDFGYDRALSADTDNSGNVFVTGYYEGFDVNIFGQTLSASGFVDMFVAKLSSTGNLMWAKDAGGLGSAQGESIATDSSGSVYVAGNFQSTMDFMGQTFTSSGGRDAFILKLSSTGGLIWAKKAGGTFEERATGIAVDNSGNVIVTGFFSGTGIDIFGQTLSSSGSEDVFFAKFSSSGSLVWLKKSGGTLTDYSASVSTDQSGNILFTGFYYGQNVDFFGQSLSSSGGSDIYLAKVSSTGSALWVKDAGGSSTDYASAVSFDTGGNILVTGGFQGSNADIFGSHLTSTGQDDIFLVKLDSSGKYNPYFTTPSTLSYKIGGTGNDSITATKILSDGSIIAGGDFEGTNTQLFLNAYSSSGGTDIFLSKISDSGNPIWTLKGGGIGDDRLTDIVLDDDGHLLVSGSFSGTNVNIFGTNLSSTGGTDAFVAKINTNGIPLWVKVGGGAGNDSIEALLTGTLSIFTTGYYSLSGIDLFEQSFTSAGGKDGFLLRLDSEGQYCAP